MNSRWKRVILVGISERNGDDTESSLAELAELAATAGAEVVGTVIQNLEHMHPGTYVGTGKLEEIRDMIWEKEATGIICDDELSPIQMRNMEQVLDSKVMDRTLLILDIFAARARTSEGKIQVELAQLKYRASRLAGFGRSMSRLGGGIGTRGPGEKKLEIDRRLIGHRTAQLNRELKEVVRHRELTRSQRMKSHTKSGSYRWLYQCRKIHASEYADGCRCSGGRSAVCNIGSDDKNAGIIQSPEPDADRYRRFYPEAAASSGRCF